MAQDWKSRMESAKLRTAAVNKLAQMGIECDSRWATAKIAQVIKVNVLASQDAAPYAVLREFLDWGPPTGAPSREINAMRQPPMEYSPEFIVAAQRARAHQPPMMSMCGRLEGWDGL